MGELLERLVYQAVRAYYGSNQHNNPTLTPCIWSTQQPLPAADGQHNNPTLTPAYGQDNPYLLQMVNTTTQLLPVQMVNTTTQPLPVQMVNITTQPFPVQMVNPTTQSFTVQMVNTTTQPLPRAEVLI